MVYANRPKMFALSIKYQDKEKIIQLNGEYIPVLPTEWKDRFNVTITVGLGTGTKEQQVVMLNNILLLFFLSRNSILIIIPCNN